MRTVAVGEAREVREKARDVLRLSDLYYKRYSVTLPRQRVNASNIRNQVYMVEQERPYHHRDKDAG